jgi:hypothetical protein
VLGFFRAEEAPARAISLATGAVFLTAVPLWYFVRSIKRKFHLQIDGLYIVYGKMNRPAEHLLEFWLEELVAHWKLATWRSSGALQSISEDEICQALEGVTVFFIDQEAISVLGRLVRGYSWGRDCVVGFRLGSPEYTRSLFRHEVSHQVLNKAGESWNEKKHHAIFQTTQLGA